MSPDAGLDLATASDLLDLFDGNRDAYAVAAPHRTPAKAARGKLEYFPVHEPLTPEVLATHLAGARRLGVYPIRGDKVKWFAVDFDGPTDADDNPLPDAYARAAAEARAQRKRFYDQGLFTYAERSRSGRGVHVWGFLDEWVEAALVRRALGHLLAGEEALDRLFPMQDAVAPGKLGNLIALPYHGGSFAEGNAAVLDKSGAPMAPAHFLAEVRRNHHAVLARLADKAPKPRPDSAATRAVSGVAGGAFAGDYAGRPDRPVVGVLKAISKYGCQFLRRAYQDRANPKVVTEAVWYAALGQLTAFENGRAAAHAFSAGHPGYTPQETDAKFDHAHENPPVGCAYVHEHFPKLACKGCPMKAPYWAGKKPILELVQGQQAAPAKPAYGQTLAWVRKVNAGQEDPGIPWNLPGFERTMLRNGELTVMGAPPSMGKTAHMVHALVAVAEQGVPVLAFSAETGDRSLQLRLLAHVAKIDSRALRSERRGRPLAAHEFEKLERAAEALAALPIYTEYTAVSADAILEGVERVLLRERLPLDKPYVVFFDYLQFGAREGDESNYEHVSRLVRQFKGIAQILDRPVVIYSQLKRTAEGETPVITDFKESGRIEADADVAAIIWGARMEGAVVPRKVTWVKQREGEANMTAELLLDQSTCTYLPTGPAPAADRPDVLGDEPPGLDSL